MELTLPADLDAFVQQQVQKGAYASPAEVVKAGLELLHACEAENEALRAEIALGIAEAEAGNVRPFAPRETLSRVRATRQNQGMTDVARGANGSSGG